MLRVEQHLIPRHELHDSPSGVERLLAPVLPLLQQRPHLRRHAPQQMRSRLARPGRDRGVGGGGGIEGAAGMLAAVSVEGCVAGPERRRRVIDGKFNQRDERRPVVGALTGKGAQDIGNDAIDALNLAGGVMMVWRAEDERRTQCGVQVRPEGASEARVAV